jgi:hypothetical protein
LGGGDKTPTLLLSLLIIVVADVDDVLVVAVPGGDVATIVEVTDELDEDR